jgi:hypothetical protein
MLYKCPYPGCMHTFDVLTNAHASTHGLTKDKLIKKHGKPQEVKLDPIKVKMNTGSTYVSTNTVF